MNLRENSHEMTTSCLQPALEEGRSQWCSMMGQECCLEPPLCWAPKNRASVVWGGLPENPMAGALTGIF